MKTKLHILLLFCLTASIGFSQSLSLPYYTGFDSPGEQAGWLEFRLGVMSTNTWGYGINACSAPNSLNHDYNVGGSPTDTVEDWYVSPPLKMISSGKVTFKISPTFFGTTFGIWLGTGNNNPATGNFIQLGYFDIPYTVFNQCLDTFVTFTTITDTGYIAIKYVGANFNAFDIDNINITSDSMPSMIEKVNTNNITVNISPNPFNTFTTISFNNNRKENCSLIIFNTFGQIISRTDNISENKIELDRRDLTKGLYFFQIQSASGITGNGKLMIQ